ncbi:putative FBD-associated F-box protein At3g50710 [Ananas comosus]|uniref:FBD-associated F-box protein At3g50710 n=1 Tax=Ananas comosus TaxID=4615 RepID=A0A6P5GRS3_ANACO|nr:putative FBD-associated F-box protein At3g50710 [Ananas comosus]
MDQLVTNQHVYDAQGYDIFTNLADDIIYKILSLLGANDQAKFALLSKRCRQLLISSPYMKFECYCVPDDPSCLCEEFIDYVDRILSQRNGLAIVSFRLQWVCFNGNCDPKRYFVDKWTNIAVGCGVQELDLAVGLRHEEELFEMPNCIFSSRFLRVLKLHLTYNILLEPFGVLASLEDLSLSKMFLFDDCLEEWISIACPSLKRLTISNLSDGIPTVRISSESLEELDIFNLPPDIDNIDISTERLRKLTLDLNPLYNPFDCILKVKAPNLQDLKWTGAVNDIYLSELKFLKKASICLDINKTNREERTICIRLAELLQSIHHVRVLQINSDIFETLFLGDRLRIPMNNLHHLVITVDGLMEYHFPIFASVLMVSPKLQTLSLKYSGKPYRPRYEMLLDLIASQFYKRHEGNQNLIGDHLSAIVVELKGKFYQTGFVIANMVKVAKGLKKITIFFSREHLLIVLKIWRDIWKAASPHLEVNLVEKKFDK